MQAEIAVYQIQRLCLKRNKFLIANNPNRLDCSFLTITLYFIQLMTCFHLRSYLSSSFSSRRNIFSMFMLFGVPLALSSYLIILLEITSLYRLCFEHASNSCPSENRDLLPREILGLTHPKNHTTLLIYHRHIIAQKN